MKELIRVRVQYASRQQRCKTHKNGLYPYLSLMKYGILVFLGGKGGNSSNSVKIFTLQ